LVGPVAESVVLVAVTVEMMVVGPLGRANVGLPLWLGLGAARRR
jgi:hypothetical protein